MVLHNCGFKPYHVELIEKLRAEGVVILAVNASHPQEIDWWVDFKKKFPDIAIMGGLHVNAEMENGSEEDVENRVKEIIKKLGGQRQTGHYADLLYALANTFEQHKSGCQGSGKVRSVSH